MNVPRRNWTRFGVGHLLILVLGIAIGIVFDSYLTPLLKIRASKEVHSFYVVGAVANPGEYNFVDASIPLSEAIARAGGPGSQASRLKMTRKRTDGSQHVSVVDLNTAATESHVVQPGDIIEVLASESETTTAGDEQHTF